MQWMILPFRRYADFRGRSRRMEFWMFQLLYWLVSMFLFLLLFSGYWRSALFDDSSATVVPPTTEFPAMLIMGFGMMSIWYLGTLVPMMAVTVRRLHDRGVSGWWYAGLLIAGFLPLVNLLILPGYLVLLVFLLLPGQEGPNKWGPDPKDPHLVSVFE